LGCHSGLKCVSLVFLVFLIFGSFANWKVGAQPDNYILKAEQHWDTYSVGGTCISGTHNLAVADVDGDGDKEVITGGSSYTVLPNGTVTTHWAPLKIWSWNGQNLTLEHSENWPGSIWCVYAGDADGDGKTEIITDGTLSNSSNSVSVLRLWNWNGHDLVLRGSYEGISVASVFVGDVDKDGKPEIVAVGRAINTSQSAAQLFVWRWDGNSLTLKASAEWYPADDIACANSVSAGDLSNDGKIEIVTCGYVSNPKNCSGQLRVWQFNGTALSLKANAEWRKVDDYSLTIAGGIMGNTMAYNVKVGDVDADGYLEIVTGGFTYNGSKAEGQLRIWNWTGGVLNLEKSQEWTTLGITEIKSISINDVDADGKKEIVTSGGTGGYGSFAQNATNKEQAELRVWSWDGNTLTLKQSKDWIIGEGVMAWNDATADLANNGRIQIVTVGCMGVGNLCDPDLRIWSLPAASGAFASFPYVLAAIAGLFVLIIIVLVLVVLMMLRKRP
jgi:hypothetical protein